MNILLIDNNDSFTRNLEHLLVATIDGGVVDVESYGRLQEMNLDWADLVVISPGPGSPKEYPGYERVLDSKNPVLGVCLGMQIINEHFGGTTERLSGCVHGKTDTIVWNGRAKCVARYHSLCVAEVGAELEVLATNGDGIPMVVGNAAKRVLGLQFHPESFLTEDGGAFIADACTYLGV